MRYHFSKSPMFFSHTVALFFVFTALLPVFFLRTPPSFADSNEVRTVRVTVDIPEKTPDYDIVVSAEGVEVKLDASGTAVFTVENIVKPIRLVSFRRVGGFSTPFFAGFLFPEQTEVVLNSRSTAMVAYAFLYQKDGVDEKSLYEAADTDAFKDLEKLLEERYENGDPSWLGIDERFVKIAMNVRSQVKEKELERLEEQKEKTRSEMEQAREQEILEAAENEQRQRRTLSGRFDVEALPVELNIEDIVVHGPWGETHPGESGSFELAVRLDAPDVATSSFRRGDTGYEVFSALILPSDTEIELSPNSTAELHAFLALSELYEKSGKMQTLQDMETMREAVEKSPVIQRLTLFAGYLRDTEAKQSLFLESAHAAAKDAFRYLFPYEEPPSFDNETTKTNVNDARRN